MSSGKQSVMTAGADASSVIKNKISMADQMS
jgi:hypothetical protein